MHSFLIRGVLLSLLVFLIINCTGEAPSNKSEDGEAVLRGATLQQAMYGVWEETALQVKTNFQSEIADSINGLNITEEKWEEELYVKPVQTYFLTENKYQQIFRGLNGLPYDTIKGLWQVIGDTLTLISPEATYQYEVQLKNGMMIYRTVMDWDGDGDLDDEYISKRRLIRRSIN